MLIKLIVIRTVDTKRLAHFYSLLGLTFEYHQHGKSPYHYSATVGATVLEIYPLTKVQTEVDKGLRLGFELDDFDYTVQLLKEKATHFFEEPADIEFGFMAIVEDPDGRKIELYRK